MIGINISEIDSAFFMCVLENFILIIEVLDFELLDALTLFHECVLKKKKNKRKRCLTLIHLPLGGTIKLYKRRRWRKSCRESRAAETVATWYNQTTQTAD